MADAAERIARQIHLGPRSTRIQVTARMVREEQDAEGVAREIVRRLHAAGGLRLATPLDLCGRVNARAEMEEIAADLIRQGRVDG